jgi:ankyrin repeat protein
LHILFEKQIILQIFAYSSQQLELALLLSASTYGLLDVLKLLLDQTCANSDEDDPFHINAVTMDGCMALHLACESRHYSVVEMLCQKGATSSWKMEGVCETRDTVTMGKMNISKQLEKYVQSMLLVEGMGHF